MLSNKRGIILRRLLILDQTNYFDTQLSYTDVQLLVCAKCPEMSKSFISLVLSEFITLKVLKQTVPCRRNPKAHRKFYVLDRKVALEILEQDEIYKTDFDIISNEYSVMIH